MRLPKQLILSLVAGGFAAIVALVALPAPAAGAPQAQPPAALPSTPAGRQAAALLQTFNEGNGRTMLTFIQERYAKAFLAQHPAERHLGAFGELWGNTNGLTLRKVESSSERSLVLVLQDKLAGDRVRLSIEVEPKAPHGILGLRVEPVVPPASDGHPLTDEELAKAIQAYLKKLVAADAFSGTVLIARGDKLLNQGAFGLASRAFQVPNRLDTKFNLGSMNKMFTAVAVAQLAEAGKLSFEQVQGTRILGHNGGFPGINSQLDIYPDKGYTVVVMSNYDPPAAGRVAQRIRTLLLRLPTP